MQNLPTNSRVNDTNQLFTRSFQLLPRQPGVSAAAAGGGGRLSVTELVPFAAAQRNLERIVLSETSQAERDEDHMIALSCGA